METQRDNFEVTISKKVKLVCGDLVNVVSSRGNQKPAVVVEITDVANVLNPNMLKTTGVVEYTGDDLPVDPADWNNPVCVVRNHDWHGNQL